MNLIAKALLTLALVWGLVAFVMGLAHRAAPTPEKVADYIASHPLDELDPADRERVIRKAAAQINQLDFEQRRSAREGRDEADPGRRFFRSMTSQERVLFTELTIGPTFDHLMKALNEMSPEERRKIADEALARLRRGDAWSGPEADQWGERGEEILSKVASEGLRSYYEEGNAGTKLDLAPVLEEMQELLQNPRHRWKPKS